MKKILSNLFYKIVSFFYINWFLIPVAISFYGLNINYHATRISLYINLLLWLVAGGIIHSTLKNKDGRIKDQEDKIEELFNIIKNTK